MCISSGAKLGSHTRANTRRICCFFALCPDLSQPRGSLPLDIWRACVQGQNPIWASCLTGLCSQLRDRA